jgi:hypothetical protein
VNIGLLGTGIAATVGGFVINFTLYGAIFMSPASGRACR